MLSKANFYNFYTMNIFCDASISGNTGCYGAIAVIYDKQEDGIYRLVADTTNNNSEIKAIRAGVDLAIKYKHKYPIINIFSDSQLSIFGLRDRICKWRIQNGVLVTQTGSPVQSQDIYMQIVYMILSNDIRLNLLHQKGHVNNHIDSLYQAQHVFEASNMIRTKVDLNLIRYISTWNNVVDQTSREILKTTDCTNQHDPISYNTFEFDRARYSRLTKDLYVPGTPYLDK